MVAFIDDHRSAYGVEPICRVLPIAPSTYFRRKAEQRDPTQRSPRAQRDEVLRGIIRRIWNERHPRWPSALVLDTLEHRNDARHQRAPILNAFPRVCPKSMGSHREIRRFVGRI
jgi:hypothetical protein